MKMSEWAKREVELAKEQEVKKAQDSAEAAYGCMCYDSAFKAFQALLEDGHSGYSISVTKQILVRLIEGKPLTPIEDTEDMWCGEPIDKRGGSTSYQCARMSGLFKHVHEDGSLTYHDVNRVTAVEIADGSTWNSGICNMLIDELYPITMPYVPKDKQIRVYMETATEDEDGNRLDTPGLYNTVYVHYAVLTSGERVELHRKFQEDEHGFMQEVEWE